MPTVNQVAVSTHHFPWTCRWIFLLPLVIGLSACSGQQSTQASKGSAVTVMTLQPEILELDAELAGRTMASEDSEVRPQVSGVLLKRLFKEGQTVKAGQSLFQIESALYQAAVNQARANLAVAEAALVTTKLNAERSQQLVKTKMIAQQEVDDAVASYKQAQATVEANRAALETALTNLRFTTVTAPISGRIGRALFTPGALVTAGQADPLARIQKLDPMNVDITQSSNEFLALRRAIAAGGLQANAASVQLKLSDGSIYPLAGKLEFADVDVDRTTGNITLRARFPNPDGQLLPGMYVRANVGQGVNPQALLVPQAVVDRTPRGDAQVWVVDEEGIVHQRVFTTLRAVGNRWLIGDGLKVGDRIVIDGLKGLRDGAKVTVEATPGNA